MDDIKPPEWDEECIRFHGRVLTGKYRHWCDDWDCLPVDETVEEFSHCTLKLALDSGEDMRKFGFGDEKLESELEMPTDDKPEGGKSVKDLLGGREKLAKEMSGKILAEEIERSDKASLSAIKESASKTAYTGFTDILTVPYPGLCLAHEAADDGDPISLLLPSEGNTTIIHDEESPEEARLSQEMFRKIDADLQYQYGGGGVPNFVDTFVRSFGDFFKEFRREAADKRMGFPLEPEAMRRTDTDLSIGSDSDLEDYIARHREWSYKTFGPGSRAEGLLKHIRKELLEIEADPGDLMEWVDVMILAIDGAWRAGFTPFEVSEALKRKQEVNFRRKWPDWKMAQDGEPIEHEK